jgi:hypothetical protein
MTSFLLLPLLMLTADEPKWDLAKDDDGVKIYARKKEGSDIREMKAIGAIDGPPKLVWDLLHDYDNYKSTMPYTVVSRVIGREGDSVVFFYTQLSLPLVSDRDYILKLVDEVDPKGTMKVGWTAVNDRDKEVPVPKDVVRVRVNDGFWLLEPQNEGKSTMATYYIYTSPGGAVPNWIANNGNSIAVPKVFAALKKHVKAKQEKK